MKITKLLALVIACGLLVEHQQAIAGSRSRSTSRQRTTSPARTGRAASPARQRGARGAQAALIYSQADLNAQLDSARQGYTQQLNQVQQSLNAQLATANSTIADLNEQITALKTKAPANDQVSLLQQQNQNLTNQITQIQSKNTQTVNGLTAQLDTTRKQVETANSKIAQLEASQGDGYDRDAKMAESIEASRAGKLTQQQQDAIDNATRALLAVIDATSKLGRPEQLTVATGLGFADFNEMSEFAKLIQ